MKILLTIHLPLDPNGGGAGTTADLARAYESEGHSVRVLSYDDLPSRVRGKSQAVAFPWFLATWLQMHALRHGMDVVDASTGDAWLWSAFRRGSGPVLVTRSHGLEHMAHIERLKDSRAGAAELSWKYPLYHGGFRLWEVATSLRRADLAFFLNRHDRDYAIGRLGVAAESAHVIPNGLPDLFLGRRPAGMDEPVTGPVRIAQVGSYIERKGVRYGAAALAPVLERHEDVSVTFLGPGCSPQRVLDDFPREVHDRIQVVSSYRRGELPGLLAGHQIKLFPTLFEGFGKAALEAMACGLAPVTTTAPGPTEFVRDEDNGLLVPPRDAPALESALERLLADRGLLARLRERAYESAQEFSWGHIARRRLGLYEQRLRERRAEPSPSLAH